MPNEVQIDVEYRLAKGNNRLAFRNPRGQKYYYAFFFDVVGADYSYERSSDGATWTITPSIIEAGTKDCFDVKIRDDGSQLVVWTIWHGGGVLRYRRGTILDASTAISWGSIQVIDNSITDKLSELHCASIARTDNGRLVVAFTEDYTTMGKDYRRTKLIGSDGDGASPTWSGETTWDDPSGNTNNQDKADVWFGLETMSGDRVLLYARVPEATDVTNYEVATAVPTWAGSSFANTTANKAISGPHDDDGKVISGVVDEADRAHLIYYDGSNTRLDSRKAASVDDDDWGSASIVKSNDVDACILTLDTGPASDELYAFYHDAADSTDFHYKKTPVDTISWGSEQTIKFNSDLIALTSWNRTAENDLHIGIEDADTDVHFLTYPGFITLPSTLADLVFPDQNYYIGPFGT